MEQRKKRKMVESGTRNSVFNLCFCLTKLNSVLHLYKCRIPLRITSILIWADFKIWQWQANPLPDWPHIYQKVWRAKDIWCERKIPYFWGNAVKLLQWLFWWFCISTLKGWNTISVNSEKLHVICQALPNLYMNLWLYWNAQLCRRQWKYIVK